MQNKIFFASRNSARKRRKLLMIMLIAINCILGSGVGIAVYCRYEAITLEHTLLVQEKQNISLQQELSATGECEKLQQLIRYDREFIARVEQKKSFNFTNIAMACSQMIPDSIILTKLYCCAKKNRIIWRNKIARNNVQLVADSARKNRRLQFTYSFNCKSKCRGVSVHDYRRSTQ